MCCYFFGINAAGTEQRSRSDILCKTLADRKKASLNERYVTYKHLYHSLSVFQVSSSNIAVMVLMELARMKYSAREGAQAYLHVYMNHINPMLVIRLGHTNFIYKVSDKSLTNC